MISESEKLLLNFEALGDTACLDDVIVSGANGEGLEISVIDCLTIIDLYNY